jgi:hypothetical protein
MDHVICHNPSLELETKARAWKGIVQKCNLKVTFTFPRMWEGVREWAHTFPNGFPLWELESRLIFREWFEKSELIGLRTSLYHWKSLKTYMFKMGFHYPFEYLQHKLWFKERSRLKVSIWFMTINVATPLWPSVGVKPNTPKVGDLESSGTPECLEFNSNAQNYSHWGVLGFIGKFLKRRYRKWPRIGHLDICRPSYGQKKGRESNWQFDSRPLKVRNRPLPDIRFESATRRWKYLDEGYNFGSDLVAIRLCSWELWAPKVLGLQLGQFRDNFEIISRLQLGSPRKKNHLDVASAESCREYYKGEGGGFPRVRAVVSQVSPNARGLSQHPKVFPDAN